MCDQQRLRSACAYAQSDQSLCSSLEFSTSAELLTEHFLEVLSLKGGCTSSSESTLVKMSNYWKSHALAHLSAKIPRGREKVNYSLAHRLIDGRWVKLYSMLGIFPGQNHSVFCKLAGYKKLSIWIFALQTAITCLVKHTLNSCRSEFLNWKTKYIYDHQRHKAPFKDTRRQE